MDRKIHSSLPILLCIFLFGCNLITGEKNGSTTSSKNCNPVPQGFKESDLIGTWVVYFAGKSRTDTLTLKDDGTYRQLFINSNIDYRYESPWYKWWLEDRPTGEAYLHLEKMLFCGGGEDTCIDPKTKMGFYDACEDKWLQMDGEFVLAVIGDKEADRGIGLLVLKPSGVEFYAAIYTLEEMNNGK